MRTEIRRCLGRLARRPGGGGGVSRGRLLRGFDLDDFTDPSRFDELLATSAGYRRDLWHFPKPVIAAVNGPAMGGGFDLAILCDLRLGTDKALFGHPEVEFGFPPIYSPLAWLIGVGRARETLPHRPPSTPPRRSASACSTRWSKGRTSWIVPCSSPRTSWRPRRKRCILPRG